MAIIPSTRYPAQTDSGDVGYPHGKARSSGSYQDGTGTPVNKDWINDLWGFQQALLSEAGITPSGTPDKVGASQYLDAVREVATASTLRRNVSRALALRALDLNGTTPVGGANIYLGAVSLNAGSTLVAKGSTNGVFRVVDTPLVAFSGGTVTGMSQLLKLIRGGDRILAIGSSTNKNAYSTNSGVLWTAGGSSGLTLVPTDGVWNGTQFVISTQDGHAAHSTNGVTWTNPTAGNDILDVIDGTTDSGLAALSSGAVVAAGALTDGTTKAFAISHDHGQTWSLAGSIASSEYAVGGYIAGNGGAEVYWLGKPDGVERLDLFVSTTGATWTKRSELPGFSGLAAPRLHMCQDTGLLVAAQLVSGFYVVSASTDRGYTWSDLARYNITAPEALAVANGRIFATIEAKLFASDVL